ncbi:putative electron transporter [Cinnamomum micranthum f. kanehirae]|uniref:Putative electron transporter n=1 Tax=Cinnamomum micranthum f. kanehirae TaxID=337451 RepID=A0A443PG97_9MAGN|nr:putative electron transporter [Cinnamomum micranthum f. kanehirae]
MDAFPPANGDTVSGRKDGESRDCPKTTSQHKRSKSASDKNFDSARHGATHSTGKDPNVSKDLRNLMRSHKAQSPVDQDSSDMINVASTSHRASLENDIKQLQTHLQQEKSVRIMLERAMGRASSTLSPGHRHTRELIQEIELLEEEVANREQHVLSLYRSIFDQCLSRPASEQSSVMTSPAQTKKNENRRHPSIISSTFCSSKKFPLQHFQVLASKKDSRKKVLQSKTRHASLLSGKTNLQIDGNCSDPTKVPWKEPVVERSSFSRTLKDHIYQCPSKLSEELVRCMGAIYCWVCGAASTKQEKGCSPVFLSRSSTTNVVLPRRSVGDEQDWPCRSMVEITWISTDRKHNSLASCAISSYRVLVEQLERVNPSQMENDAKMAFWINVYNSLVMHAYLAFGIPHNSLRRVALFHKAAYNIGGYITSANSIEHAMLSWRTPRIGRWFESILSTAMWRKSGEERQLLGSGFGLSNSQPLVCFALSSGASSDPVLRVYSAANVKEELEVAKKDYLQANVVVKRSKKVFLPRILERYSKETSISSDDLLSWVCENVDKKLRDAIQKCIDSKSNKKLSHIMEWSPYDTRFRFVFPRDLTEKPWWV